MPSSGTVYADHCEAGASLPWESTHHRLARRQRVAWDPTSRRQQTCLLGWRRRHWAPRHSQVAGLVAFRVSGHQGGGDSPWRGVSGGG
ncbi:hypothetical protein MRX96_054253 [Rhipicephalus microplus]